MVSVLADGVTLDGVLADGVTLDGVLYSRSPLAVINARTLDFYFILIDQSAQHFRAQPSIYLDIFLLEKSRLCWAKQGLRHIPVGEKSFVLGKARFEINQLCKQNGIFMAPIHTK